MTLHGDRAGAGFVVNNGAQTLLKAYEKTSNKLEFFKEGFF